MTVELAERMGVPEDQLVHLRRGALLHDIGKMGVPDAILLKPGSLARGPGLRAPAEEAGSHFDPEAVEAFLELDLEEIPIPERTGPEDLSRPRRTS